MVVSSAVCIFMCICEMMYLLCRRMQKRAIDNFKNESQGKVKEIRAKGRLDPTVSVQNLNNIETEREIIKL